MTRVRIIGAGRAGRSFALALGAAGWDVAPLVERGCSVAEATRDVHAVIVATPDSVVAQLASAIEPSTTCVVVHLSGSLGLAPLAGHSRRAVVHPLVALPDAERGAARLRGAWFATSASGDPLGLEMVETLDGHALTIAEDDWVRYHVAAVIASNHLVALMGQAARVAGGIGVPLDALLDLARGALDDVAALGPASALTGPVRRGDLETVRRHIAVLPADERAAYEAMSAAAARLLPDF